MTRTTSAFLPAFLQCYALVVVTRRMRLEAWRGARLPQRVSPESPSPPCPAHAMPEIAPLPRRWLLPPWSSQALVV